MHVRIKHSKVGLCEWVPITSTYDLLAEQFHKKPISFVVINVVADQVNHMLG